MRTVNHYDSIQSLAELRDNSSVCASLGPDFRMAFRYFAYFILWKIARYLSDSLRRARPPRGTGRRMTTSTRLTRRERQCLILAARGKTDWEIARLLALSEHTVHSYFKHIKRRFGVCTRVHAVVAALMAGEISLDDIAHELL